MKKNKIIVFTLLSLMAVTNAFSQKYIDEIASKSCECIDNIPEDKSIQEAQMELGLCMLDASSPYKKQLKKDHGIDFSKIDTQGEKLGRIIGMKMAGICPTAVMRLVGNSQEKEEVETATSTNTFVGEVSSIEDSKFVVFTVKNELGKQTKFYWLTFIESNVELISDYKTLTGKSVNVTYIQQEFFDSRIGEYRVFNIIQNLEVTE